MIKPTWFHVALMNPPIIQLITGRRSGSLFKYRKLEIAVQNAPIATPDSIIVVIEGLCAKDDMEYAIKTANIPPMNAAIGSMLRVRDSDSMGISSRKIIVAPSPAPDATPIK